jgi:DNA-binding MarR family transcriptional regulator
VTRRASPIPGQRYRALLTLLRAAETIWNSSRLFFARWNLSPAQFNVLNLLGGQAEGLTQSDLGRQLLTHRSNVTGLVDRLQERGLVRRREMASDRRAWRVVLTPEGARLRNEILPHYHTAAEAVWNGVKAGQLSEVEATLEQLAHNAAQMTPPEHAAQQ